ncbi:SixA phosphatase family protein [Sphingomonas sp. URHD0057]|uniref:SixA phosphatase family protein n=1 Tax=Sphingomonas sp. URHD0057 TaxID=1380389 RepID=UPI00048ECEE2|nr:histidine phosphatase family protein [Sphingomonas sp. URHD0057]
MKRLTVLRHAKSSWKDRGIDDFDRPLNGRGRKAARRVGLEMKDRGLRFDIVLASPAARVRETLEGVQENCPLNVPIRIEPRIYMARVAELLELLATIPDEVSSALLVGHNTSAERLVAKLSADDDGGLRRRVEEKFPTAALAAIELPVESWADLQPENGRIVELIYPADLAD